MRATLATIVLLASPAAAAERSYSVTTFERVRIDAPVEVRLSVGGSPRASASGDPRALDRLDLEVQGTTLIVRMRAAEDAGAGGAVPTIVLSTPLLSAASVVGGGRLTIAGLVRAQRVDFQLSGSGALAVPQIDADQLNATLFGSGTLALGGRAGRGRLLGSGSGTIDATPLVVGDLIVNASGTGELRATARYTADVTSSGVGGVTIAGTPKCLVHPRAAGPIACGAVPAP